MDKKSGSKPSIGNVVRIIDSYTIIVNVGCDILKVGDKIQIYEPIEMIKDTNGNDLGFYNYIKDTLNVIKTENLFSVCRKNEVIEKTTSFALSPLLERKIYEKVPLNIDANDICELKPSDPLIRVGDLIKLA